MNISVCIDMMFSYLDFYDRFKAVKQCGMDAVEFWRWSVKDMDRVCEELEKNELALSVFNLDSKDEALSADLLRGILNQGRKEELKQALEESIPIYRTTKASGMIVLIGETLACSYEKQIENILECLEYVKPVVEQNGVTLLLEPLNNIDRKNYFLPESRQVFEILRQIASPNMKLLFDIYHEQMMRGGVIAALRENIDWIGHFHVADVPGRHEPGTGELYYPNILKAIEGTTYGRFVGLEYRATRPDPDTFGFLKI